MSDKSLYRGAATFLLVYTVFLYLVSLFRKIRDQSDPNLEQTWLVDLWMVDGPFGHPFVVEWPHMSLLACSNVNCNRLRNNWDTILILVSQIRRKSGHYRRTKCITRRSQHFRLWDSNYLDDFITYSEFNPYWPSWFDTHINSRSSIYCDNPYYRLFNVLLHLTFALLSFVPLKGHVLFKIKICLSGRQFSTLKLVYTINNLTVNNV
jgi:hypothetical protein